MCMYIHSQLYTLHYQEWKSEGNGTQAAGHLYILAGSGLYYYLYCYTVRST